MSNRIEEIKRNKDGLDVLADIHRYATTGEEIDPDDFERMKWYGVFHRRQTPGFFMMRLRITNGRLTARQSVQLGEIINKVGRGNADFTTRENLQFRWLRIEDIPAVFDALQEAGIDHRQTGMDNVRNITGCPMAGLDPDEVLDTSDLGGAIRDAIIGLREFSNLPRKFNISVSGCRHDCAISKINDIGLTPATRDGVKGFNVHLGGALGGKLPRFASDADAFLTEAEAPAFCAEVLAIFRDHGTRENRQKARLKFLLEDWGMERFRGELESRLGLLRRAGCSETTSEGTDHVGVQRQKQPGLNAVGLLVPVGRVTGDDLIELGRLAETYGSGEIRLTNGQNVLLVNVPTENLDGLLAEPLLQKFSPNPDAWLRGSVSCTGNDYCHYSLIDTKGAALDVAHAMSLLAPVETPMRVHWSGCPHACGQHGIADIGFQAARVRIGDEIVDAADVYLGGSPGPDARLANKVLEGVPLTELPARLASLVGSRDRELVGDAAG